MRMPKELRKGYLTWISRILLTEYYDEVSADCTEDTYDEEEVTTMVEMAEFWLDNDKPEATERELIQFMYDNRRL
jgi:hypothetical protein